MWVGEVVFRRGVNCNFGAWEDEGRSIGGRGGCWGSVWYGCDSDKV